jgi:hypothetical protein
MEFLNDFVLRSDSPGPEEDPSSLESPDRPPPYISSEDEDEPRATGFMAAGPEPDSDTEDGLLPGDITLNLIGRPRTDPHSLFSAPDWLVGGVGLVFPHRPLRTLIA